MSIYIELANEYKRRKEKKRRSNILKSGKYDDEYYAALAHEYKEDKVKKAAESGTLDKEIAPLLDRIAAYGKNYDTYLNEYYTRYGIDPNDTEGTNSAKNGGYLFRNDTQDYLDKVTGYRDDMAKEAAAIQRELMLFYEPYLDKEYYDQITSGLSDSGKGLDSMVGYATTDHDWWSKWESEDQYKDFWYNDKFNQKYGNIDTLEDWQAAWHDHSKQNGNLYSMNPDMRAQTTNPTAFQEALREGEYLRQLKNSIDIKYYDAAAAEAEIADLEAQLDEIGSDFERLIAKGLQPFVGDLRSVDPLLFPENLADKTKAIEAELSEKKANHNNMVSAQKRLLDQERYDALAQNSDYEYYSQIGADLENPTFLAAYGADNFLGWKNPFDKGEEVKNVVTFSRDNIDKINAAQSGAGNGGDSKVPGNILYQYMREQEINNYNYFVGKGDYQSADEYLKHLEPELEYRRATDYYQEHLEGKPLAEILYSVPVGFDQFASGMQGIFSDEYTGPSETAMIGQLARQDLSDDLNVPWYNLKTGKWEDKVFGSSGAQAIYDALSSGANMLPSVLVSLAVEAALPTAGEGAVVFAGLTGAQIAAGAGAVTMGASAMGNAKQEMLGMGYSVEQANAYGLLVGASEAGLSYLLSGIPGLRGNDGIFSALGKKVISKVDNALARAAITLGGNMLDEGLEEGLQTVLEGWFKEIATGVDFEDPSIDEILYSSLLGALTAAGFGGGKLAIDTGVNAINTSKVGKGFMNSHGQSGVGALAAQGLGLNQDTAAYKQAQKIQTKLDAGKSASNYSVGKLYSSMSESQTVTAVQTRLSAHIENKTEVRKLSDTITDILYGRDVSDKALSAVADNKYALNTLNDVLGAKLKSGATVSDVRAAVKSYQEAGGANASTKAKQGSESKISGRGDVQFSAEKNANGGYDVIGTNGGDSAVFGSFKSQKQAQAAVYAMTLGMGAEGYSGLINLSENLPDGVDLGETALAFNAIYNQGKNGKAFSAVKNANLLSPEQRQYAYNLGIMDKALDGVRKKSSGEVLQKKAESGKINNNKESGQNEQGVHLRDGGERDGSENPGGEISAVESGARQDQSREENGGRPRDREAASLTYGKEVSAKSLGIEGGLDSGKVYLIAEGNETAAMKKARKRAEKRGKKVTFFAGGNLEVELNGETASVRGYIKGDNIYVRADHPYFTSDQLMRHEIGHDMIANGEVDIDRVRERIKDRYEDVDFVVEQYSKAYEGSGLDADEIWEEIICDSLGDMNLFASVEVLGEMNDEFLSQLKGEAYKSSKEARGPPKSVEGKASAELGQYTKEQYENFGWVRANNVISAGCWRNFTENFAQAVTGLQTYPKAKNGDFMIAVHDVSGISDIIIFANGTIEIPNVTQIIKINASEKNLDNARRLIYESGRRGIQQEISELFRFYNKTSYVFNSFIQGQSGESTRNSSGDGHRSSGQIKVNRIVEFHIDEEKGTITTTYANGETVTESLNSGKASRDLDFVDFLNENAEDRERSNREVLANLLESEEMSPSEKGFLTKYKNKIAQIEANEAEIAAMESELKELRKAGKKDSSRAITLEGKIKNRELEIARDENMILNLESTKPIKELLKREKDAAYAEGMLAGQMAQGRQDAAKLRKTEEKLAEQKRKDGETLAEYKKRVAEREAEIKQKNREKLAEQREKARENLDAQAKRYQESRKKATEGRHKTAMRHKIAGVVSELDKLLRKGTKERNVKIGLQDAVAAALEIFDLNSEKVERYNKAIADLDARIAAATDPVEIEALTELRDKKIRNSERLADKLQVMKKAYEDIHNGRDGENYPSYYKAECEAIENRIAEVMEKVGDTPIGEMSLEQLEAVYDMYRMVLTTVRNANKVFKDGKLADLTADAADMTSELQRIKKLAEERLKAGDDIRGFVWNELTPYYAFNRIGSDTLMSYYNELIRGQDVYARDIEEAQSFAEETRKKHGYGKWKLDQVHSFKDKDGRDFRLTLKHMMSIYAYSKREQAFDHMEKGGFFFNNKETFRKKAGVLEFIASNESGYKVDARIFAQIKSALTADQIAYVDEMQAYLTQMGEKGNEVTRQMWGIDLFKEKAYFPLKSKEDFIYQANTAAETSSLKNDSMTKETKPHASNPIVLESFDDVWANHVEKMSKYHGFVVPIDNLNKLVNYGTWINGETATSNAESSSYQNQNYVAKRLSEGDLKEYLNAGSRQNKSKVRALNEGKRLILTSENEIADFIDDSINGEHGLTTVAYGKVADRLSSDVDAYSKGKIDISNYYLELIPNDINHAFKEHTNAKQDGDIDLSLDDFHNIPNYLDNYDELVYAIQFESGATRICVSKKIDTGRVILIETVSKSRGSIEFKNIIGVSEEKYNSAYKDKYKKGNKPNSGGSQSSNISPLDGFVSNNSIPPSGENVNRNFSTNSEMGSHSISTMLEARFGPGVNDYLNTFIKDLNGAKAQRGGVVGGAFDLLTKFKKTSVAASLSVVVQQPTAILRATSEIDPKYFVYLSKPEGLNRKWNQIKKYAPIAIIKDIGGFDAGSGKQITEWMNADTRRGTKKVLNKIDDLTMYGAALGDRIGWGAIWQAVIREVQAKQGLTYGTEEFWQACGKRFTDVIVKTQVYDSTLSRSGFMRGKDGLMKMATAFMGEPTLSINMLADTLLQAKRGKISKGQVVRTFAAVYTATVAASIIKSFIYALRDDDEDESLAEKYMQALGGSILNDINPLSMLPILRDVVSIFQGWDVERTDMAVVQDLYNAINSLGSEKKTTYRKIEDLAGAVAALVGVPVKNVMRTAREIYNAIDDIFDGIDGGDLGGAFLEGITGEEKGKTQTLYEALIDGDPDRIYAIKKTYKTEESYLTAVRKALRTYDPRIKEAAQAQIDGDISRRNALLRKIVGEGIFDEMTVSKAIAAEVNSIKDEESSSTEPEDDTPWYDRREE